MFEFLASTKGDVAEGMAVFLRNGRRALRTGFFCDVRVPVERGWVRDLLPRFCLGMGELL